MNKTIQQKLATHFGVKHSEGGLAIKEVNENERTIKAIANTYYWIDSDQDMLVKGSSTKSINDRGVNSSAVAKIKHQSDHVLNTQNTVGRITVLDERVIDGKDVLYFESFIPETRKGNDDLMNYKSGLYDNHSIGFRYKVLELAVRNSQNADELKNWNEFYPMALNPEKADEMGFFWVVKEIELFEISVVSFGANQLTPYLGSKSATDNNNLKAELLDRIDQLNAQLKSNVEAKTDRKNIDMECLQLKQIITDLQLFEPSKKATRKEPTNNDTKKEESKKQENNLLTILSKNYKNEK